MIEFENSLGDCFGISDKSVLARRILREPTGLERRVLRIERVRFDKCLFKHSGYCPFGCFLHIRLPPSGHNLIEKFENGKGFWLEMVGCILSLNHLQVHTSTHWVTLCAIMCPFEAILMQVERIKLRCFGLAVQHATNPHYTTLFYTLPT